MTNGQISTLDSKDKMGLTFKEFLTFSINSYKKRFITLFTINLLPVVLVLIVGFIISVFTTNLISAGEVEEELFKVPGIMLAAVVFIILSAFIHMWTQVALLFAIRDDSLTVLDAFKASLPKMKSYIWLTLLTGFIVMGGFLFFFIPGIIFAFWYSFALFVLISDDLKGMQVLHKSREIISGKFLWLYNKMFLLFGVCLLAFLPVFIVAGILDSTVGKGNEYTLFVDLSGNLFSLLVGPLFMIAFYKLYEFIVAAKGIKMGPAVKQSKWPWFFFTIGAFMAMSLLLLAVWTFPIWKNIYTSSPASKYAPVSIEVTETTRSINK